MLLVISKLQTLTTLSRERTFTADNSTCCDLREMESKTDKCKSSGLWPPLCQQQGCSCIAAVDFVYNNSKRFKRLFYVPDLLLQRVVRIINIRTKALQQVSEKLRFPTGETFSIKVVSTCWAYETLLAVVKTLCVEIKLTWSCETGRTATLTKVIQSSAFKRQSHDDLLRWQP